MRSLAQVENGRVSCDGEFEGKGLRRRFQYQEDGQKSERSSMGGDQKQQVDEFRYRRVGKKIFAVRRGYHLGIYFSWPKCKIQVRGYLGAKFRGFKDRLEAVG